MKPLLSLLLISHLSLLTLVPLAQARTWTATDGRTMEGEYLGGTASMISIRRADGTNVTVPVANLSEADRAYVMERQSRKAVPPPASPSTNLEDDASIYIKAVAKINDDHVARPVPEGETLLTMKLLPSASTALQRLLAAKDSPELVKHLVACGEAALDLDRMEDFTAVRTRLAKLSPDTLDTTLGSAVSRPRFIIRGIGKLDPDYLSNFADLFDSVLKAYDELFGFKEFSKVPGKKLRVRVHLEAAIERPPHFAPEFPWHSQIDFPIVDPAKFTSPTQQGQMLLYGLCHELGHVIAMWGDLKSMEDHHAWAHYTGVAIVEHLAAVSDPPAFLKSAGDLRWRSLKIERDLPSNKVAPSVQNYDGVMALLIALHDQVGARAIGDALNRLDARKDALRVNHVRYYNFADFRESLLATLTDETQRKAVTELLPP
jgi:hypothetical protein